MWIREIRSNSYSSGFLFKNSFIYCVIKYLFYSIHSNEVLMEISQNVRSMMEELWLNWSHLGVDDNTKVNNITKLVQIEKELHRDVISETRQKLKTMQGQVDSKS